MKNYTYIGTNMAAFTIGEGETAKNYFLSKGATTSLPEDHDLVKDMVSKKMLVEAVEETKPAKNKTEDKK